MPDRIPFSQGTRPTRITMNHPDFETAAERSEAGLTPTPGTDPDDDPSAPADSATANNAVPSKFRMKRMTLNDAQKYEICIYMREEEERAGRPTNKSVAAYILNRYDIKVDESTVSRLKQQAEIRLSRDPANPSAKRHRQVNFPELERLLGEYVQENKKHVVITDPMIIKTGKDLRVKLNIPPDQIKFSDGWLNKFKVRHGLKAATVHKIPRVTDISQRAGTSTGAGAGAGSSSANERPRQSRALATSLGHDAGDMTLSPSLPPSSTSMEHDDHDHQLDVDMELSTAMDVEHSDGDQTLTMEQTFRQHQHSHSSETNNHGGASSSSPAEHPRRHLSRSKTKASRINSASDIHKAAGASRPPAGPTPQLETMLPLTSAAPSMSTGSSAGSGLTVSTPGAAPLAASMGAGTGSTSARPGPPVTAARASLSLRFADPVAAGFQPEPPVDFLEASRCVDTLRIFMQQHNFSNEQLHHLKDIYMTMDTKRKQ